MISIGQCVRVRVSVNIKCVRRKLMQVHVQVFGLDNVDFEIQIRQIIINCKNIWKINHLS